ncbi:MAG TPA: glycosyltransferase [Actinomycetota bacterium]|nr:glycosyltransferase [Actinomycetota bacterium]
MLALTILSLLALVGWLYLLGGHGWFWMTDQRLPRVPSDASHWPDVTAVVPARDEAAVLPQTLPGLLTQRYPGELTVVLVDDQSRDGTAGVARALAAALPQANDLVVVQGSEPPPGWAGKVWAMAQGARVAAARTAGGHLVASSRWAADPRAGERPPTVRPGYVLFTDADIAHAPGSVAALVRAAEAERLDLVSQMALLRTRNLWERRIVPAFVYFFAMLYPFSRVNRPDARTAAAAGGCMLVRAQALEEAGGLERVAGARIDDVALAKLLKRRPGGRVWLGFGERVASRRDYPELTDLWNMIARSAYTQLRYSPWLLAATVAGLLLAFLVPPVAALGGLFALAAGAGIESGHALVALMGLGAWAAMSATWVPILRLYRLSPLRAPSLPLVAVLYLAMTLDSARRHRAGQGGIWKGRGLPRTRASV